MTDSSLQYTPRGDRVVVRRFERPPAAPGSMAIPDSMQKQFDEGEVLAVGPGERNRFSGTVYPVEGLAVRDHVCFLEYAGTEIEVDGEKLLSLRDEEIHGVRKQPARKQPHTVVIGFLYCLIFCVAIGFLVFSLVARGC